MERQAGSEIKFHYSIDQSLFVSQDDGMGSRVGNYPCQLAYDKLSDVFCH